jgi:GTPase SAR1 family protein
VPGTNPADAKGSRGCLFAYHLTPTVSSPSPMAVANSIINCKLLLIGNSSVGKSSLLMRFSDEQWLPEDEASATIGVDFRVSRQTSFS